MSAVEDLRQENAVLRRRATEAQAIIHALIAGEVDSVSTGATSAPVLVVAAQDALRRSEERFVTMFRRSPVAFAISSVADRTYLDANDRFLQMLGFERDEVIGRSSLDLIRWIPVEKHDLADDSLRRDGSKPEFEATLRVRAGESRTVLLSTERIELDGRECDFSTVTDITHRKRAQEMEEQFERFFTLSADMLCITRADGEFPRLNPAFDALGYATDEIHGKELLDFVHPADVALSRAERETLSKGDQTVRFENRLRCKDGSYKWLLWAVSSDASGTRYAAGRDVTESKRTEDANCRLTQKLLRSNGELEELAMIASHDLQEPLRKIRMFGDRLQANFGATLGPDGNDYIARMQNAAARGQALISGLLAYSRVTTKGRPLVDVDLADVARKVAGDLEGQVASVHGRIEIGHLPVIEADPLQMRQLFQNLVSNSLKFHAEGIAPIVRIDSRRSSPSQGVDPILDTREWWQITVADNGIGFDAQYAERIFGLFQRLNGRSQYEGSGIGLAICKKIVDRHGGSLTAESGAEGGATFIATLPRRAERREDTDADTQTA